MKAKELHQQAMELSFKAKKAQQESKILLAIEFYVQAAAIESKVAEFYFDKPELEPTRSVLIRSAAYMNLKAGLIEEAQRFIFFGLLNCSDEQIKLQLNDALELSISLKKFTQEEAAKEFDYLKILRQRSIHYTLEPSDRRFGSSVTLQSLKHFIDGYLKSMRAYGLSQLRVASHFISGSSENVEEEFTDLINPVITQSAYGSFKFSIANDFLARPGEPKPIVELKSNIVNKYHNEIFTNPLTDESISVLRESFDDEEINQIFKPLIQIKSNSTPYKIAYYDTESYNKVFSSTIINKQKVKLITPKVISKEDIGALENLISHKRLSADGKVTKKTLIKEELKAYDMDYKIQKIEPIGEAAVILTEPILVNLNFSSDKGFTISFDDLDIQSTDIEFDKTFNKFYDTFFSRIVYVANLDERNESESRDWDLLRKLISSPEVFITKGK